VIRVRECMLRKHPDRIAQHVRRAIATRSG
jgi:hypothetical protein